MEVNTANRLLGVNTEQIQTCMLYLQGQYVSWSRAKARQWKAKFCGPFKSVTRKYITGSFTDSLPASEPRLRAWILICALKIINKMSVPAFIDITEEDQVCLSSS